MKGNPGKRAIARRLRGRLSVSNLLAVVALLLALGGSGVAVALTRNDVKSRHIAKGAVRTPELARNAVKSRQIKKRQVRSKDLKDGSVKGVDLRDSRQLGEGADGGTSGESVPVGAQRRVQTIDGDIFFTCAAPPRFSFVDLGDDGVAPRVITDDGETAKLTDRGSVPLSVEGRPFPQQAMLIGVDAITSVRMTATSGAACHFGVSFQEAHGFFP